MHRPRRFFWLLAFLALPTFKDLAAAPTAASLFPPLNSQPSRKLLPGKFVWADLFTDDPIAAADFYAKLFGWTITTIGQKERTYLVLSHQQHPIAGIVGRWTKGNRSAHWVPYLSTPDISQIVTAVTQSGGKILAPVRNFPQRGQQAIVADAEGSLVGLLQSSSGDPPDDEPVPGEWNWIELFARDPSASSQFYQKVFAYEVTPDDRTSRTGDLLLAHDGETRGGIMPLPKRAEAQPGWLPSIRVSDIDATVATAQQLGGRVLVAPHPTELESRFAIIADPTDGAIGLIEYQDSSSPSNPQNAK